MLDVLLKLAKALNAENIVWGIGGSLLLKSYGIVDEVNDIDIIVSAQDIVKAVEILDRIAVKQNIPLKEEYKTKTFLTYKIDDISIDVMSSFIIMHPEGEYEYKFGKDSISKEEIIADTIIPYTSLEDWFVAYSLMVGRDNKVKAIRDYLRVNGVANPNHFVQALQQELPLKVINSVKELLMQKENL